MSGWSLFLLAAGSGIILWAQATSGSTHQMREENKDKDITYEFNKGPYMFSRSPTHIGLGLALAGFALAINSSIMLGLAVIAFIVTRLVFIAKEEKLLIEKYGDSYRRYKKSVWF